MKEIKLRQYSASIIDAFEDFLDDHNIEIPNDEKEEDNNAAHIYGSDYDELETKITNTLLNLLNDYNKKIICVKIDTENY